GTAAISGDLGTFAPGKMVAPINDAVFNGKEGSLYTVTSQVGVHLIKVNKLIYNSNDPKYNIAYIAQPIIPSESTQNNLLDDVLAKLETTKKIEDLSKIISGELKMETATNIKKNDFTFASLGSSQTSRDIIRWAFEDDTDIGSVSSTVYTYTDDVNYVDSKYVFAALKSIDKPGLASVESIKSTIEPLVKKVKKGEIIKARIKGTDLNTIASTFDVTTGKAENLTFGNANISETGPEPLVVGLAFALAAGATSEPIVGNAGVYVVKLISKTPPMPEMGNFGTKMQLTQAAQSQVTYRLMEALKKTNKADDNRFTFF
ncbi:MAG: peptidylprolyl isomerase, partial [Saprospiraceae bacterium]|nr:peptidylprolyl isomerase [Saprospiraceae bacterium]